jgi:large subunit ribosomal protein L4
MEPLRFEHYPAKHLHLPLRRDILHKAVVFEGDATRQGTASSKTRWEVHGSHRKIRPQKGLGMARLGTRQSPMLRGGGKSFGPKPRDFATGLPRKMYDLAWRTALSYRYRKGELIICEDGMEISDPEPGYAKEIFLHNQWGKEHGKSLVITEGFAQNLFSALSDARELGRVEMAQDVDVKDLLSLGRIIIEKKALDMIIRKHRSDLAKSAAKAV